MQQTNFSEIELSEIGTMIQNCMGPYQRSMRDFDTELISLTTSILFRLTDLLRLGNIGKSFSDTQLNIARADYKKLQSILND